MALHMFSISLKIDVDLNVCLRVIKIMKAYVFSNIIVHSNHAADARTQNFRATQLYFQLGEQRIL